MTSNKTILITGATKGIGLATSQRLAKCGYQIIGIARQPEQLFPGHIYLCDLENIEQTTVTLNKIANEHIINGIINNVGIVMPQPLGKIDLSSLEKVFSLNVRTAVQVVQTFIESMKTQRWGRIINIASRAIFGIQDRTSYSAAKSALVGCTRTWALELAKTDITVNAVAPGPIETALFRSRRPVGSATEKEVLDTIPMGRIGKPEEIAATIEFLLSEDAGFITGQTICVDGGGSL